VDLSKLDIAALKRYRRHFKLVIFIAYGQVAKCSASIEVVRVETGIDSHACEQKRALRQRHVSLFVGVCFQWEVTQ